MGRLTVTVDEALLDEARKELGTSSKRETIVVALEEVRRRARTRRLLSHQGKLDLGITLEEFLRLREEP